MPGRAAEHRRALARTLLQLAIGALCLAALVAIGILLFGDFGETEGKILLTVVAVAGYSLLGLAATTSLGEKPVWLGPLGLAVSALGFVLAVGLIWVAPEGNVLGRLMGAFLILAIALAHAALLLLMTRRVDSGPVRTVRRATLAVTSVVTVMVDVPLLLDWTLSEFYGRLLGAMIVLAVLGTLLVPILKKLSTGTATQSEWATSAAAADSTASGRLDLRYKGRTFVVETTRRKHPTPGFTVAAQEVTRVGREPLAWSADPEVQPDPPTALAFAVRQIVAVVDRDDLVGLALNGERLPTGEPTMHPRSIGSA